MDKDVGRIKEQYLAIQSIRHEGYGLQDAIVEYLKRLDGKGTKVSSLAPKLVTPIPKSIKVLEYIFSHLGDVKVTIEADSKEAIAEFEKDMIAEVDFIWEINRE